MPEGDDSEATPAREHLLLDELSDRLETLKLIRTDDEQRADAILEQFGAKGRVESEMLDQLSARLRSRIPIGSRRRIARRCGHWRSSIATPGDHRRI